MVMLVIFLGDATHAHTGYYTLAFEASLPGRRALHWSSVRGWPATPRASRRRTRHWWAPVWPCGVGSLRLVVGLSFIVLPLVITSVNPDRRQPPGGRHGHSRAVDPELRGRASRRPSPSPSPTNRCSKFLAKDPAAAAAVGQEGRLTGQHLASAVKAFGLKGLSKLAATRPQLQTLVEPYQAQLTFIEAHQAALTSLQKGSAEAPHQWQHWFYVDLGGMVVFMPLIWLTKGRWKPSAAKRDAREHAAVVQEELARLTRDAGGGVPTAV